MSADGASIREALQRYKAGIPTQDMLAIDRSAITDPALDVAGIMLHLGRHSADPGMWSAAVAALLDLLGRLRQLWDGWTPRELDVGGGFPVPRGTRSAAGCPSEPRPPPSPLPWTSTRRQCAPRCSPGSASSAWTRSRFSSRSSRGERSTATPVSISRPSATSSGRLSRCR